MSVRRLALSTGLAVLVTIASSFGSTVWVGAESISEALLELGPTRAAIACAFQGSYRYDPRTTQPDLRLISQPPDAEVVAFLNRPNTFGMSGVTGVTVTDVDVRPAQGLAMVWATVQMRGAPDRQEQFVLQANRSQWVMADIPAQTIYVCQRNLGDWRVVSERP